MKNTKAKVVVALVVDKFTWEGKGVILSAYPADRPIKEVVGLFNGYLSPDFACIKEYAVTAYMSHRQALAMLEDQKCNPDVTAFNLLV